AGARRASAPRPARADLSHLPPLDAAALLDDQASHLGLLDPLERLADLGPLGLVGAERVDDLFERPGQGLGAGLLVVGAECREDPRRRELADAGLERGVAPGVLIERPARLARLGGQLLLGPDQPPAVLAD